MNLHGILKLACAVLETEVLWGCLQDESDEELFPVYLKTGRTSGYDAPALDPTEQVLLPEDWVIRQLQEEPTEDATAGEGIAFEPWLKTGRTSGYDAAAVDPAEVTEPEDAEQDPVAGRTVGSDVAASSDRSSAVEVTSSLPQQIPHIRLTESEVAAKVQPYRSPRASMSGMPHVYHAEVPGANQVRALKRCMVHHKSNTRSDRMKLIVVVSSPHGVCALCNRHPVSC